MEELLFGTIRMHIPDAQFCLSTDSMVLADFCRLPPRARVLDLGCGCGALGLLLLGAAPEVLVDGIEIQPDAAQQAARNAEANGLSGRFRVFCSDLRQMPPEIAPGSYDCAVSNPPYYPPGSGHLRREDSLSIARSELMCSLDALCAAAARALRWGGRFFLVHKPERLTDLLVTLRENRLEPKRLQFVRHHPEASVSLVLVEARSGAKPGLTLQNDLILYTSSGEKTADYKRLYHEET